MADLCFYVTSHGFGHATRAADVINHIPTDYAVEIISAAPGWLFEKSLTRPFSLYEMHHDSGIVQPHSFEQDAAATYEVWKSLLDQYPEMARAEAARIKQSGARVVVGDISPFAVAVAREAGLPSVIVANFSWDWILRDSLPEEPRLQAVIEAIADLYGQAGLLLRTPLSPAMAVFPRRRDIALIARYSKQSVAEARAQFGLDAEARVAMLSFGGIGFSGIQPARLAAYPQWTFLTFSEALAGAPNARVLDHQATYHPDAVHAADVVIAKLGYGTVSECLVHQTPVAHPPRSRFPEHAVLQHEAASSIQVISLEAEPFFDAEWPFLESPWIPRKDPAFRVSPADPNTQGGGEAARILTGMVDEAAG